eukprot:758195-Hanusia_phi.AAC.1
MVSSPSPEDSQGRQTQDDKGYEEAEPNPGSGRDPLALLGQLVVLSWGVADNPSGEVVRLNRDGRALDDWSRLAQRRRGGHGKSEAGEGKGMRRGRCLEKQEKEKEEARVLGRDMYLLHPGLGDVIEEEDVEVLLVPLRHLRRGSEGEVEGDGR